MNNPNTVDEVIELLVADVSDVPSRDLTNMDLVDPETKEFVVPQYFATPRQQLYQLLLNIVKYQDENWNGPRAAQACLAVMNGAELDAVCQQYDVTPHAVFCLPLIARTFPRLITHEIGSIQPVLRQDAKIFFLDIMNVPGTQPETMMRQMKLCSKAITASDQRLMAMWLQIERASFNSGHTWMTALLAALNSLSREIALELNSMVLEDLLKSASTRLQGDVTGTIPKLFKHVFVNCHENTTHLILGKAALDSLHTQPLLKPELHLHPAGESYEGLRDVQYRLIDAPEVRLFWTPFWSHGEAANRVMALRRGSHWADTPSVWAPYLFTATEVNVNNITRRGYEMIGAHNIACPEKIAVATLE